VDAGPVPGGDARHGAYIGAASDARDRSSDVLERPLAAVVNAVSSLLRVRQQGQFGLLVCG
jgi:hypothetical protein